MIAQALNKAGAEGASTVAEPTAPPSTDTADGRDAQGRFVAGNKGGPGNPYARQVAQLKQALLDALSAEDIAAIARALVAKAKEGNVPAARLVFSYALGKPSPPVDPDRLDAEEWRNLKETSGMFQEMPGLIKPGPELPLTVVRSSRPALAQELGSKFGQALATPEHFEKIFYPPEADSPQRPSANGHNGAPLPGNGVAPERFTWGQVSNLPAPTLADLSPQIGDRLADAWPKTPPKANGKKRTKRTR